VCPENQEGAARLIRLLVITLVLAAAAADAGGELTVSAEPAQRQDESLLPYLGAELTIDNSDGSVGQVIRAVSIRCADGGATLRYAAAIAPRTRQTLRVRLPAVSVRQEVDVRLMAGPEADAGELAWRKVVVRWPEELLARAGPGLIDPAAYQAWERQHSLPRWPEALKRNIFLTLVVAAVAATATLLIGRSWLRLAGIALVVAAAAAMQLALVSGVEKVSVGDFQYERLAATTQPVRERMLAVTCLRSADWHWPDAALAPVYRSVEQMAADTMVVNVGQGISVALQPDDVRLFRRR
jgi:hypothetical protein